jgi:hypothetical protein
MGLYYLVFITGILITFSLFRQKKKHFLYYYPKNVHLTLINDDFCFQFLIVTDLLQWEWLTTSVQHFRAHMRNQRLNYR